MLLRCDIRQRGLLTPTCDILDDIFVSELEKWDIQIQRKEMPIM